MGVGVVWPKTGFCCKVSSRVLLNGLYGLVLTKKNYDVFVTSLRRHC